MRIAFVIHTPGQAHLWRYPILRLQGNGNDVLVVARDDGITCALLQSNGIHFTTYGKGGKTSWQKVVRLPVEFLNSLRLLAKFEPQVIVGTGVVEAYSAVLLRKASIVFEDSEPTPSIERAQWKRMTNVILTPSSFRLDLGKKQVRFEGYKELAYLHPDYFEPDPAIFAELGIAENEKYVVLRFNAFDAVHDIRRHGFSVGDQFELVRALEKDVRVFISPEGKLANTLEKHRLPVPRERIHHALYYAQLLLTDTQTMATEAAILGTAVVRCNNFVGPGDMGNFVELEKRYGLLYSFQRSNQALQKALELIQQPDLKEEWHRKRQRLLADKIDVTRFLVDFIENYPSQFQELRRNNRS